MILHIDWDSPQDLVITCEDDEWLKDPNFKKSPGINCYLEEYVKGNENQQWYYNADTGYFKDVAHGYYLIERKGVLVLSDMDHLDRTQITDQTWPWWPQWFDFCPYDTILETEIGNGIATWVSPVQYDIKRWGELQFHVMTDDSTEKQIKSGKLKPEYCYQNF